MFSEDPNIGHPHHRCSVIPLTILTHIFFINRPRLHSYHMTVFLIKKKKKSICLLEPQTNSEFHYNFSRSPPNIIKFSPPNQSPQMSVSKLSLTQQKINLFSLQLLKTLHFQSLNLLHLPTIYLVSNDMT